MANSRVARVSTKGSHAWKRAARTPSVWVGVGGVLCAIALGIVLTMSRSPPSVPVPTIPPPAVNAAALLGLRKGPPPWPAEKASLRARLRVLGLPALSRTGTALHTHQHVDVFVDGKRVIVPAGIGIGRHFISPIHTHDASGIVHVESPTRRSFSLAELFGVWGVRLTRTCLGGECDAGKLHLFVNGRKVLDPNAVVLTPHQEIVVAFGRSPKPLPSTYSFPKSL